MSGSAFSLEWLATGNGSCNDTVDEFYLLGVLNDRDTFGSSSNLFSCPESYERNHYSSMTSGPQLDNPYYKSPDDLPAWNFSLATTTASIPPDTTKPYGCRICGDTASGNHFGVLSCEACKSFFRRSMRANTRYACRGSRTCTVNARTRGRCQYCRLSKCLAAGMKKQAIQDEDYFKSSEQLQSSSCSTPIGSLSNLSNPFHIVQHECQLNMNFGFMYETNYSENVHTSNGSIASSSATSQPSPIGSSLGSTSSSSSGQLSSRPSSSPGSSSLVSSAQQTSFCLPSDVFLDDWFQVAGEHQMEEWEIAQDLVRGLETRLKGMIQWSMGIPEFSNLDEEAQVSLIQNSWCEQCILQLAVCNANRWGTSHGKDKCPTSLPSDQTWDMAVHQVMLEVVEVGYWLEHLGMDRMEMAFLRRILLFDPVSAGLTPTSRQKVESCQDQIIAFMTNHASKTYGSQSHQRGAKLLYQLAPLKIISKKVIQILKEQKVHGTVIMGGIFDELIDF